MNFRFDAEASGALFFSVGAELKIKIFTVLFGQLLGAY
jgi:hypothetical protein